MAEDVDVKFGAEHADFDHGVDSARGHVELFGASITQLREVMQGFTRPLYAVRENLGHLAEAFAAVEVARKIGEFVEAMTELGERTERLGLIFGITAQEVGFLSFVATQTGGSADSLMHSLERLALSLQQAEAKTTPTARALRAMGLDAQALSKLPLVEMLDKMRARYSELAPGIQRTAIAQALVRGGAETMLPILSMSDERWQQLRKTFDETGASMTGQLAEAFAETGHKIGVAKESLVGLGITIFDLFRPAVDTIVDGFTKLVEAFNNSIKSGGVVKDLFAILAIGVDILVAGVLTLAEAFTILWDTAIGVLTALKAPLVGIAQGIDDALGGNFSKVMDDVGSGFTEMGNVGVKTWDKISGSLATYKSLLRELFESNKHPAEGLAGFGPPKPAPSLFGGDQTPGEKTFEKAIDAAERQTAALKAQAEAFGLSKGAAAAYEEEQKLIAIALQNNIPVTDALRDRIKAVGEEYGKATEKLELMNSKQAAFSNVAEGISGAVVSWMQGTKTLGQAFLELAAQLAAAVVQAVIFNAVMAAFGMPLGGGGGPFGSLIGAGFKAIGLDEGAWEVKQPTLAVVHPGESVVPQRFASGMRAAAAGGGGDAGGGSGGGNIEYHDHTSVQALDATGMRQVLSLRRDQVIAALRDIARDRPHELRRLVQGVR